MNMRSIYANPYKYACECNIPIELAKIACKKFRHIEKVQRKHFIYCPVCDSKHLYFEHGSYEECYSAFFECENCGETFCPSEIPNIEYLVTDMDNFDPVLYFSCTNNKLNGWKEACGATTLEEWVQFAIRMIIGRAYDIG